MYYYFIVKKDGAEKTYLYKSPGAYDASADRIIERIQAMRYGIDDGESLVRVAISEQPLELSRGFAGYAGGEPITVAAGTVEKVSTSKYPSVKELLAELTS